MHSELIARLKKACANNPAASIQWPHRVLHDAVAALESLAIPWGDTRRPDPEAMAEARAIALYETIQEDQAKRVPWTYLSGGECEKWRRAEACVSKMIKSEAQAALSRTDAPQAPFGWKLVPVEPTPEIIAGAAVAAWQTASADDIAMARLAAPMVLMQLNARPGLTVDMLAALLATMAPAYRAMTKAAPQPPMHIKSTI